MRRLIPIVVLAVLLTGCKVKIDQGFELNSDGSGTASIVFGFDQELVEMMSSFSPGGDPFEDLSADLPGGWDSKDWSEGDYSGMEASISFGNLAELHSIADLMFTGEDGLLQSFMVESTGDGGFRFEASMSGESFQADMQGMEGFGFDGSLDELSETFFDAELRIKLPGEVISHNADHEESDGTLVWDVRLTDSGRMIRAESVPGGGLPLIPIAAAGAVALLATLALILWKRRAPAAVDYDVDSFQVPVAVPVGEAVAGDPFA
ncbi:MAG: hypothetical protein OEX97_03450 [Acidimicrobiia bacterium]|nr:hypothetical protein [Acidimicrobiia bacterium]